MITEAEKLERTRHVRWTGKTQRLLTVVQKGIRKTGSHNWNQTETLMDDDGNADDDGVG